MRLLLTPRICMKPLSQHYFTETVSKPQIQIHTLFDYLKPTRTCWRSKFRDLNNFADSVFDLVLFPSPLYILIEDTMYAFTVLFSLVQESVCGYPDIQEMFLCYCSLLQFSQHIVQLWILLCLQVSSGINLKCFQKYTKQFLSCNCRSLMLSERSKVILHKFKGYSTQQICS